MYTPYCSIGHISCLGSAYSHTMGSACSRVTSSVQCTGSKCSAPVKQNFETATLWLLDAAYVVLSHGNVNSAGIDAWESSVVMNGYHTRSAVAVTCKSFNDIFKCLHTMLLAYSAGACLDITTAQILVCRSAVCARRSLIVGVQLKP